MKKREVTVSFHKKIKKCNDCPFISYIQDIRDWLPSVYCDKVTPSENLYDCKDKNGDYLIPDFCPFLEKNRKDIFKCERESTGEVVYSDKVMVGGKEIVDRFLFNDNTSITLKDARKNKDEYHITKIKTN